MEATIQLERLRRIGKRFVPPSLRGYTKSAFWAVASRVAPTWSRNWGAIRFWRRNWKREGGRLRNDHYERFMLAMAGQEDPEFLRDRIVADFGCGPRGSLCWAEPARVRIGIDILADAYSEFDIASHNMCYVRSSEKEIPLPSDYVDVLFTMNAIDHVRRFGRICQEIVRVLAPGGEFIGSFNLNEPRSRAEPQTLTEDRVHDRLLRHLEVRSYRIAARGPVGDRYRHLLAGAPDPGSGERVLWVRAAKPAPAAEATVSGSR